MITLKSVVLTFTLISLILCACKPGCDYCDASGNTCYKCKNPKQKLFASGACADVTITIDKCDIYAADGRCARCLPAYRLSDNTCFQDPEGCLLYSFDNTKCLDCGFGRKLVNGQCTGILNCAVPDSTMSGMCQECAAGFYAFEPSRCDADSCSFSNNDHGYCTDCLPSTFLNGYECVPSQFADRLDNGCTIISKNGDCRYCHEGFTLRNGVCAPSFAAQSVSVVQVPVAQPAVITALTTAKPSNKFGDFGGNGNFANSGSVGGRVISNCAMMDEQGQFCAVCNLGFDLTGDGCIPSRKQAVVTVVSNPLTTATTSSTVTTTAANTVATQKVTPVATNVIPVQPVVVNNPVPVAARPTSQPVLAPLPQFQATTTAATTSTTVTGKPVINTASVQPISVQPVAIALPVQVPTVAPAVQVVASQPQPQPTSQPQVPDTTTTITATSASIDDSGTFQSQPDLKFFASLIPNCQEVQLDDFSRCKTCLPKFVVDNTDTCVPEIPNCGKHVNGECGECKKGFILVDKVCKEVPPGCINPDKLGKCDSCEARYSLDNGVCTLVPNPDVNCLRYIKMKCTGCAKNLIVSPEGFCKDPKCVSPGPNPCTACAAGFYLNDQKACLPIPVSNCVDYVVSGCRRCEDRFYLSNKACVKVDASCKDYDLTNGKCTSCAVSGLVVVNGVCLKPAPPTPAPQIVQPVQPIQPVQPVQPIPAPSQQTTTTQTVTTITTQTGTRTGLPEINCKQFVAGICTKCSNGYYRKDGGCVAISPLCKTSNSDNGDCLSCFPGYVLVGNACVLESATKSPANCKKFVNGLCQECAKGYFPKLGVCTAISPLCATSSSITGECQTCFPGYALNKGTCVVNRGDPNCKITKDGVCQECIANYLKINGKCIQQNPVCKTVDKNTNFCITCYPGYILLDNTCYPASAIDPNCARRQATTCLECNNRFYMNKQNNSRCTAVSPNCLTYDMNNGSCLSCTQPYMQFINGECLERKSSDPNCQKSDPAGNCLYCIVNYYLDTNASCKPISILCAEFDYTYNLCTKCQDGYFLQDGDCIYPSMGIDPFCIRYEAGFCSTCQTGYYLLNYICTGVDPRCQSFNYDTSTCDSCREGQPVGAGCSV